jgi:hypothetical protein
MSIVLFLPCVFDEFALTSTTCRPQRAGLYAMVLDRSEWLTLGLPKIIEGLGSLHVVLASEHILVWSGLL